MSAPKIKTIVTTRKEFIVTLDRAALLALFLDAGRPVPPDAEITFTVQGGADWSNSSIDISHDSPITVTWATVERTDDQS